MAKGLKKRLRLMKFEQRTRLYSAFGRRLKKLRLKKGLTPTQFSRICGIDPSNLRKYENGLREPGLAIIMVMAKSLETDHLQLLDFAFDLPEEGLTNT